MGNPIACLVSWLRGRHATPDTAVLDRTDQRLHRIDAEQARQAEQLAQLRGQVIEQRRARMMALREVTEEQNRRLFGDQDT